MATASELQALLRFLTQDAKVPLATAISSVKPLQSASLGFIAALSTAKLEDIHAIFPDEKQAKSVLNAAKRVSKRKADGGDNNDTAASSPQKANKRRRVIDPLVVSSPAEQEAALALPEPELDETQLRGVTLITNRAPLVLAFAVVLLTFTMPRQPLSSRLSLAQAMVSVNARARAINLGIEKGSNAADEGWGEGQPVVKVMNREVRCMRRWGYFEKDEEEEGKEDGTALWGIDLEALKKTNGGPVAGADGGLPVHTPQSARAYLLKSFASKAPAEGEDAKSATGKGSAKGKKVAEEKERNLGLLLGALQLLYESWAKTLTSEELDRRAWGWYVSVRPDVEHGPAGWGGKGEVSLERILGLRR